MAATVTGPLLEGDVRVWYIDATAVATDEEIAIPMPWQHGTVLTFEATLVTAGSATGIRPRLGYRPGFAADGEGQIVRAEAEVVHHRDGQYRNAPAPDGNLYVVLAPDAEADQIRARLSMLPGAPL